MIFIVVPTIREKSLKRFRKLWKDLFKKHSVVEIYVHDGDEVWAEVVGKGPAFLDEQREELKELIFNKNDGVRNFGFWIAGNMSTSPEDIIITLDDDVEPIGDPIEMHLGALSYNFPTSWFSPASQYTRGFPYGVRGESEAVLSHGVWLGEADWDAPTQLVNGNRPITFYQGAIPKGIYYPMCGMNVAFKRKILPYMYYAPMGPKVGMDRFTDIWCGIESKRAIDKKGWAVVTGWSAVLHKRASNVWKNLQKEARGLELNETFWQGDEKDPYFKLYKDRRLKWEKLIKRLV